METAGNKKKNRNGEVDEVDMGAWHFTRGQGTYHVLVYFYGTSTFFGVMLVLFNCHLLT
jgi:hypothetical protein